MSLPQTKFPSAVVQVSSEPKSALSGRIDQRTAVVGVLGLGYVGLPFCLESSRAGFKTIGFDVDQTKVLAVSNGVSCIRDIDDAELQESLQDGNFEASAQFDQLRECDVIVIAVPTPLTENLAPDLSYITSAAEMIAERMRPGQLITLESTTYPGTTEEVLKPILEAKGFACGRDFFLAHSPERVDPGNQTFKTKNTPKVVGGVGPESLEIAEKFYGAILDSIVPVSSARTAELVKVYENVFRAVNVGLVNELTLLCDRMGLDVWEVLDAAYTKPFGIMPFYPGPGVGGHCIPLDPHYLEFKAKEYDFVTRFIATAGEVNRSMPRFVVEKAMRILNEAGKALSRSKVVVLGAAYKKDINDSRESPAIHVIRLLKENGAEVDCCDPYVPTINEHGVKMNTVPLTKEILQSADLVILATEHSQFDIEFIAENSRALLDTRNASRGMTDRAEHITRL